MSLSDILQTFNHGKGLIKINRNPGAGVTEGRPIELHLKEDGAADESPSFAIIIEDSNGNKVLGQISLKMLSEALDKLGYTLTKN